MQTPSYPSLPRSRCSLRKRVLWPLSRCLLPNCGLCQRGEHGSFPVLVSALPASDVTWSLSLSRPIGRQWPPGCRASAKALSAACLASECRPQPSRAATSVLHPASPTSPTTRQLRQGRRFLLQQRFGQRKGARPLLQACRVSRLLGLLSVVIPMPHSFLACTSCNQDLTGRQPELASIGIGR